MLFGDAAIIRLETVDSTNNYAANLLKLSRVPEGTVITALEQTAGKGQRGSKWNSNKGDNLLCSIILYPKMLRADMQFLLSQAVALAVRDMIEELVSTVDVQIKWPNDIVASGKKVCGILIETTLAEDKVQSAIVGIGININQQQFTDEHAQSIRNITGQYHDLESLLEKLMKYIAKYYLKMYKGQHDIIREQYIRGLFNFNVERSYICQGEKIRASITGVENSGKLKLKLEDQTELVCDFKEIALVWND